MSIPGVGFRTASSIACGTGRTPVGPKEDLVIRRAPEWLAVLLVAGLVTVVAFGDGMTQAAPPRATTASTDPLWTPAQRDTLKRLNDLLAQGRYADLELGARSLLASLEAAGDKASLRTALALDHLANA